MTLFKVALQLKLIMKIRLFVLEYAHAYAHVSHNI